MNVSISTNGILLDELKLNRLINSGLKLLQISIDGLKESHEKIRGENTFELVISKIHLLKKSGIAFRVGCVINKYNYTEIEEFVEFIKSKGVSVINFFRFMPSNGNEDLELSACQLLEVTKKLINLYYKNTYDEDNKFYITFESLSFFAFLLDSRFIKYTDCSAGLVKFNLGYNGSISLCNYIYNAIGNIKTDKIDDVWEKVKLSRRDLSLIPSECISCKYSYICKGGCKGFSYIKNKNFNTKDLGCFIEYLEDNR